MLTELAKQKIRHALIAEGFDKIVNEEGKPVSMVEDTLQLIILQVEQYREREHILKQIRLRKYHCCYCKDLAIKVLSEKNPKEAILIIKNYDGMQCSAIGWMKDLVFDCREYLISDMQGGIVQRLIVEYSKDEYQEKEMVI